MVNQRKKFATAAKKCAKDARNTKGVFSRTRFNMCMKKELKSKQQEEIING